MNMELRLVILELIGEGGIEGRAKTYRAYREFKKMCGLRSQVFYTNDVGLPIICTSVVIHAISYVPGRFIELWDEVCRKHDVTPGPSMAKILDFYYTLKN